MRLLATAAGSDWMPCIAPTGSDEAARAQADGTRKVLEQLLREILVSEHLLILAGLGTTLCLKSPLSAGHARDFSPHSPA
jgi:hypothetical protein